MGSPFFNGTTFLYGFCSLVYIVFLTFAILTIVMC
ncbi:uncharacterized protein [Drosophila kikkawai]|uniref:Uncharacterized protein n=1 Tax=Drosophila kikkawai TaxID=30033 RepID=A0ABM3C5U1_DROKI|nr:uncharacterized protein LOC121502274 [Drosophila kikkawai]